MQSQSQQHFQLPSRLLKAQAAALLRITWLAPLGKKRQSCRQSQLNQ